MYLLQTYNTDCMLNSDHKHFPGQRIELRATHPSLECKIRLPAAAPDRVGLHKNSTTNKRFVLKFMFACVYEYHTRIYAHVFFHFDFDRVDTK